MPLLTNIILEAVDRAIEQIKNAHRLDHLFSKVGFPGNSDGKESACNAGNMGLISGLGKSPGDGNGNPLLYSCLENSMDRGA